MVKRDECHSCVGGLNHNRSLPFSFVAFAIGKKANQVMKNEAEHVQTAEVASTTSNGVAMTMTNASPLASGRRIKFTPQVIEQIKGFVAVGISLDEIANRVGVTVGSLQVTCSRLGISLRPINGSGRHTADVRGRTIFTPCSIGIAHVPEQKEVSQPAARAVPLAEFAMTMRYQGKERTTDIPLPSAAIEMLALEAMSRDLSIAALIGRVLVAVINKDTIHKILRDEVPPSPRRRARATCLEFGGQASLPSSPR